MTEQLESSWKTALHAEFDTAYFNTLSARVIHAYATQTTFPPKSEIFQAFSLCPLNNVKVVIIGQDPYHGAGQAHGLAFSVRDGVKIPPSLQNIYKELKADTGTPYPDSGNLEHWAKQGVLLLNTTLTVTEGAPGSHASWGWEHFTDAVIQAVSAEREHVVFLLWGKHAHTKEALVDQEKHLVLTAPHPSPLSAHRGFFGCQHFSQTNTYLRDHNITPINW